MFVEALLVDEGQRAAFLGAARHVRKIFKALLPDPAAAATVKLTRELLLRLATREAGLRELVFSDELAVEGSRLDLLRFLSLLDSPAGDFPIVTP